MEAPDLTTTIRPALPVDLDMTLGALSRGPSDPSLRKDARGAWWRASRTPHGPSTTRFEATAGDVIRAEAWGAGAEWAIANAPGLLGAGDSLEGFAPTGRLLELHRRHAGMRITRSRAVFEACALAVCEQMVTFIEARESQRRLARAWSDDAPGPGGLRLPPAPETIAKLPSHELRACGLELKRANTLRGVARRAARVEEAASMPLGQARARLQAFPGVGAWTAAEVALTALGDADAVALGDFHLPNTVSFAFTGEPRGDEARMLELLAPYAGHRGRVVRLLGAAGIHAPRFGPRHPLRRWR